MKVGQYRFLLADGRPVPAERLRVVFDDGLGVGALYCGGVTEIDVFNDVMSDGALAFLIDGADGRPVQVKALVGTQVEQDDVLVLFARDDD